MENERKESEQKLIEKQYEQIRGKFVIKLHFEFCRSRIGEKYFETSI